MPSPWVACRLLLGSAWLIAALGSASAVQAQEPVDAQEPPHVAYAEGAVTLERDGQADAANVNTPVVLGDRLRTAAGRLEILFPDGSVLDLDEYSAVELLAPTLLRLLEGRALLTVSGAYNPAAATRFQIDTPVASARTDGPGEYRIAVRASRDGDEAELAVLRGAARLTTDRESTFLRAGERMLAFENGSVSLPEAFNSARFDDFDRWAAERRRARVGVASAQYLPNDLRMYGGTLDQYGSWQYNAPYGYVWYPTVSAGWQPYFDGYWSPLRSYGWTWVGLDLWSWPTHHFGRWGYGRGSWFWIPGRTWGPAWVSWASAPGYVSWCPLGFDSQSVFALSSGVVSRAGWVVVSRSSFGHHAHSTRRDAIASHLLPRATAFTVQAAPPVDPRRSLPPSDLRRATDARTPVRDLGRRSGVGGSETAVRRSGPVNPPVSSREFKRPLPGTEGTPASAYRSGPVRPTPSTADRAVPRVGAARSPEVAAPRYYRGAPPAAPPAQTAPASPAVPRWTPPTTEWRRPPPPQVTTPFSAPPAQSPQVYSGALRRAEPANPPATGANPGGAGSSSGAVQGQTPPPSSSQPATGGSSVHAAPRSEGHRR